MKTGIYPTERDIISHGRWPVAKLVPGQTIRFNQGMVTTKVDRVYKMDNRIIIDGDSVNGVAFLAGDYVELVSFREAG